MHNIVTLPTISESNIESTKFYDEVVKLMTSLQYYLDLFGVLIDKEYKNSLDSLTTIPSNVLRGNQCHIITEGEFMKKKIELHVQEDGLIYVYFLFLNPTSGKWEEFGSWFQKTTMYLEDRFEEIVQKMK